MTKFKYALAVLAVVFVFGLTASTTEAADVKTKKRFGIPIGVVVTLNHNEAEILGKGQSLNIPDLPAKYEKPLRDLAAKIKAADKGNGVKVTLTVRVNPPGINSKVEAR